MESTAAAATTDLRGGQTIYALDGGGAAVEAGQEGLDQGDGAVDVGDAVGDRVGVEETLAEPDDRVGQGRGVQAGLEAAAVTLEVDEPLQRGGHALVDGAAGAGEQAQR